MPDPPAADQPAIFERAETPEEPVALEPASQEQAPVGLSPEDPAAEPVAADQPAAHEQLSTVPAAAPGLPAQPHAAPPPLPPSPPPPPPSPPPASAMGASSGGRGRPWRERGRPRGRSPGSRALALIALAVALAAVVLLVKSLSGSGNETRTAAPAVVRVVIPEGTTRLQIAHIAATAGLTGNYRNASKHSGLLNPTRYGAPAGTHDLEGFLFPATYDMTPKASVNRLVHEQLIAFRENFGPREIGRAQALHLTPYQLLTVASMIEREAKVPGDRAKIAAVIYNRLKRGMPLGVDATIYYALEMRTGIATYTKELTAEQLRLDSAYNTRIHTGLPPTPISNPGVASIEAAAHPAHASYLYYVLASDGCGEHVFSTTLARFEADAAAYRAAVKKNGGAPPACKK
ncbi:MAG TPA: endolytic transglycosylase MltG [Solirubrobacteraceae bacterium]|nr:endolytic transglycosylase MltG [Solirubrobacteraceae bacterium]